MNKNLKTGLIVFGSIIGAFLLIFLIVGIQNKWFTGDPYRVDVVTGRRYPPPPWANWGKPQDEDFTRALVDFEVTGLDVSYWQGYPVDYEVMISRGATFVFIRAAYTYNYSNFTDPYFEYNSGAAVAAGLYCGEYFYTKPGEMGAISAADYFIRVISDSPCQLPPVLDAEDSGGLSKKALADWYKMFLDRVELGTGEKPIIYTRTTFWDYYVESRAYWSEYKLWIARYVSDPVAPFPPYDPVDWETWNFWQWSSTGDGDYWGALSNYIDLDLYNGTLTDFETEFEIVITPTPTPTPAPETIQIEPGCYFIGIDSGMIIFSPCDANYLPLVETGN